MHQRFLEMQEIPKYKKKSNKKHMKKENHKHIYEKCIIIDKYNHKSVAKYCTICKKLKLINHFETVPDEKNPMFHRTLTDEEFDKKYGNLEEFKVKDICQKYV